jgi:S-adenosylmethionine synthetase
MYVYEHTVDYVLIDSVALQDRNSLDISLPTILHFSSQSRVYTKLEISQFYAKQLGIEDTSFLTPVTEGPKEGETKRPRDCHLSNAVLESIGIRTHEEESFESWFSNKANLNV